MVNKQLVDEFARALQSNGSLARQTLEKIFNMFTDRMSEEEIKQALLECYPALVEHYGNIAAAAAADFYTQQREQYIRKHQATAGDYNVELARPIDWRYTRSDVRKTMARFSATENIMSLYNMLDGQAQTRIMNQSDRTITRAARFDPLRPKWAIVPGASACPFCRLMGSYGFHFNTKGTANCARHKPNPTPCRCTVVVDFDTTNPMLDGYDPRALDGEVCRVERSLGIKDRDNQRGTKERKAILKKMAQNQQEASSQKK